MRKGRRFTPQLLNNWEKDGRGQGIVSSYQPFHQVGRADPSSYGRSYWNHGPLTGRHHHYLSDGENLIHGFCSMMPEVIDIREQFKLERDEHMHALSAYHNDYIRTVPQGTIEIANRMGIKHSMVRDKGVSDTWRFTTDFLLTTKDVDGKLGLLAVAYKPLADLNKARNRDLLRVEQAYWRNEGVEWLLITPHQYSPAVAMAVRHVQRWADHPDRVSTDIKLECARLARKHLGKPLNYVMTILDSWLEGYCDGNTAFFQAVWSGFVLLDLNRSNIIFDPVGLLSEEAFRLQNPIMSRRSAWL